MMRKQCCSTVTAFYSDGSHILGPGFPGVCGILDTLLLCRFFPHPLAPRDDSLRARFRPQVLDRILRWRLVFGVTTRKTLTRTASASSRLQMSRPCLSVWKTSGRVSFGRWWKLTLILSQGELPTEVSDSVILVNAIVRSWVPRE